MSKVLARIGQIWRENKAWGREMKIGRGQPFRKEESLGVNGILLVASARFE